MNCDGGGDGNGSGIDGGHTLVPTPGWPYCNGGDHTLMLTPGWPYSDSNPGVAMY